MKERPVFPLIMSMALPMVISMLVNSLYNIVDSYFVAKISEDAMTALSLVYPVQNFINAVAIGFGVGINALIALMCGCVTNIILDPVMIFGLGPFPEMGIEGAALATGIGQVVNLAIYLVIYKARPVSVRITGKYLKPDKGIDLRLYSIGIPAALNLALPSLLISVLNSLLAAFSQSYVVILGIYYKLQTFLYLPASGIVQGMRPVIGYNYGAGEYKRVRKIYLVTLAMSSVIMIAGTIICLAVPGQLIGLFTANETTVQAGKTALRIISAGFLVSAVSVTSSGALEGLGKGTASLVISLCRYVIVILPAAFLLSRIFGAAGVWNAFWIAEAVTAIVSFMISRKKVYL